MRLRFGKGWVPSGQTLVWPTPRGRAVVERYLPLFPRRRGVDREGVNATGEIVGQYRVDHAMTIDPALASEGLRHDIDAEMALAARPVSGVSLMQM